VALQHLPLLIATTPAPFLAWRLQSPLLPHLLPILKYLSQHSYLSSSFSPRHARWWLAGGQNTCRFIRRTSCRIPDTAGYGGPAGWEQTPHVQVVPSHPTPPPPQTLGCCCAFQFIPQAPPPPHTHPPPPDAYPATTDSTPNPFYPPPENGPTVSFELGVAWVITFRGVFQTV